MFKCVHLGECVYREWTTTRCRMHFCPRLKKLDYVLGLKRQSIVILMVPLLYTRHFRLTACNFSNNHVVWVL